LGRYVWLEGRVRGGVFRDWARRFRYRPQRIVRPTTEEEIVELVKSSRSLRMFGSGHSFNSGVASDETLASLDDYTGLLCKYPEKNQIAVRSGTCVRDVVELLSDEGLAFRALPSHDAQSMAGILSTDVHGTGKIYGTLYLFPFMDECQVNTWNRKEKDRTPVGRLLESIELTKGGLIEFVRFSMDALAAAWIGNFIAYTGGSGSFLTSDAFGDETPLWYTC
jgi:hypothetical protein